MLQIVRDRVTLFGRILRKQLHEVIMQLFFSGVLFYAHEYCGDISQVFNTCIEKVVFVEKKITSGDNI